MYIYDTIYFGWWGWDGDWEGMWDGQYINYIGEEGS